MLLNWQWPNSSLEGSPRWLATDLHDGYQISANPWWVVREETRDLVHITSIWPKTSNESWENSRRLVGIGYKEMC